MVVSDDVDIIENFVELLKESLNGKAYPYSKGKDKLSIILDVNDILGKPAIYKLDAFRVKPSEQIPMLLYSTGSKEFNIVMRRKAKKKGMLLNQKGLFKKTNGKVELVKNLNSEKDYFDALNMEYKEPKDRV